jgi:hypothetical protein
MGRRFLASGVDRDAVRGPGGAELAVGAWMRSLVESSVGAQSLQGAASSAAGHLVSLAAGARTQTEVPGRHFEVSKAVRFPRSVSAGNLLFRIDTDNKAADCEDWHVHGPLPLDHSPRLAVASLARYVGAADPRVWTGLPGVERASLLIDAVFCSTMPAASVANLIGAWVGHNGLPTDAALQSAQRLVTHAYQSERAKAMMGLNGAGLDAFVASANIASKFHRDEPNLFLAFDTPRPDFATPLPLRTYALATWRIFPRRSLVVGYSYRLTLSPFADDPDQNWLDVARATFSGRLRDD